MAQSELNSIGDSFTHPAWLYQMSSGGRGGLWQSLDDNTPWYPSSYRKGVKEGEPIIWDVGNIYKREEAKVSSGDTVIFFFCKTGEDDPETGDLRPGIYGWGKIITPPESIGDTIEFQVAPPSDKLKINPLWCKDIERLTNEIRRKVYQGTMWNIKPSELKQLGKRIFGRFN